MIYCKLSPKQLMAMTWWNRPHTRKLDGILCDGAVRSGKTVCMADGFFLWSMASFQNQVFGICGKTIASLRRNLTANLPQWLEGVFTFREYRQDNRLVVTDSRGRRNTYYLFGGQDESSGQLIQGITLAGVLLDEAALMPQSFVEQACARCSVPGSKLWFNCNPEGPEHWFYRQWVCKCREKHLLHLHFTMDDNPSLAPAVRARYERLYTGVFYQRYILGRWAVADGLVYAFDKSKHLSQDVPPAGRYFISVDYGTVNPFSAGLWCVADARAWRLREFYYCGRDAGRMMTDEEYYRAVCRLAGTYPIERIVVDPSAASFIATIRTHGRFSVRRAKNEVLPGIQLVSRYLAQGRLLFHPNCENAIREFAQYCWEPDQERPKKECDHAMDEIRYFCTTVLCREVENGGEKNVCQRDRGTAPLVGQQQAAQ